MSLDLEPNAIIAMLSNPELYKKLAKPYKNQIMNSDIKLIQIITEIISGALHKQREQKPMILLNGIRFIKETLDKNPQNVYYQELVAERILPEMVDTAKFDKDNKQEDRGKFYFGDQPSNELAILGNSFFRLVLECIKVWAGWFPESLYSYYYNELLSIGVSFPDQLNYFKDENGQRSSQVSQGQILNSQKAESNPKIQSLSQIQQQQGGNTIQVKSSLQGLNLNVQRSGEFSKIFVQVLIQFYKVKEGVRINLMNDNLELDQFNQSIAEIRQFYSDFKVLLEKIKHIETSPSFDQHRQSLQDESLFAENFLSDIQAYKQKQMQFEEFRNKYTIIIKPLRSQSSASPSNQQYGQQNDQNFNEYNQSYGKNHFRNGDSIKEQGYVGQNQYSNREDFEEEEKYNQQNSYGRKHEDQNYNTPTPQPSENDARGRGNHHQSQLNSSQNNKGNSQYNSYNSGYEKNSDMGSQQLVKKQSFKHLFEQNDMDKYKIEMRSGSSYRKMSPSPSNQSTYYSSSMKSALIKKPGAQGSSNDSQISLQADPEEAAKLKNKLETLEKERNMWKQKYEEVQFEIQKLRQNNHE